MAPRDRGMGRRIPLLSSFIFRPRSNLDSRFQSAIQDYKKCIQRQRSAMESNKGPRNAMPDLQRHSHMSGFKFDTIERLFSPVKPTPERIQDIAFRLWRLDRVFRFCRPSKWAMDLKEEAQADVFNSLDLGSFETILEWTDTGITLPLYNSLAVSSVKENGDKRHASQLHPFFLYLPIGATIAGRSGCRSRIGRLQ